VPIRDDNGFTSNPSSRFLIQSSSQKFRLRPRCPGQLLERPVGRLETTAWFIPADTIQVLTAAVGLRYCFEGVPRFNNINSLAEYYFFAVLLGPFAAAFVSAPGIPGNYWTSWRISFLSEVLAFITLAPAILSWFSEGPAWVQKRSA
jgi:integral membrane sensor domain MASE1